MIAPGVTGPSTTRALAAPVDPLPKTVLDGLSSPYRWPTSGWS
jgi:hypothetical protein